MMGDLNALKVPLPTYTQRWPLLNFHNMVFCTRPKFGAPKWNLNFAPPRLDALCRGTTWPPKYGTDTPLVMHQTHRVPPAFGSSTRNSIWVCRPQKDSPLLPNRLSIITHSESQKEGAECRRAQTCQESLLDSGASESPEEKVPPTEQLKSVLTRLLGWLIRAGVPISIWCCSWKKHTARHHNLWGCHL